METRDILLLVTCMVGGYLVGSLSPAVYITRRYGGFDVRKTGSGNAGATNVLRSMGWVFGLVSFSIDTIKGVLPTLLALKLMPDDICAWAAIAAGSATLIGHVLPVLHHFKGGKAVATTFGVMLVIEPLMAVSLLGLFLLIAAITGYISLGSVLGISIGAIASVFVEGLALSTTIFTLFAAVVICVTHRSNIMRLYRGEESKLDLKKIPNKQQNTFK